MKRARTAHGDRFTYDLSKFRQLHNTITVICEKHGNFSQRASVHLNGSGCPTCKSSRGEVAVRLFLEKHKIPFVMQAHIIPENKMLSFDFHLQKNEVLVEFNGRQHYSGYDYFGGLRAFRKTQKRDRFKAKWAAENGYELIVIPYFENVEEVLSKRLLLAKAA